MTSKRLSLLALAAITAFVLAGCTGNNADGNGNLDDDDGADGPGDGGSNGNGATGGATTGSDGGEPADCRSGSYTDLVQAGSSTVLPIAEAWAEEFRECLRADITVGGGGTGGGFQKFCRGELHIADASRPIRPASAAGTSETDLCLKAGIEPFEVQVAIDGLSVVVAQDNDFVKCLTVQQLNKIWTADKAKQVSRWNQLDASWPDQAIVLFGPDTDSGTFDYFREVIIRAFDGSTAEMRSDFSPNPDDNALVQGVSSSKYAMGYFGLAYFEENQDELNVVKIDDGGKGCVEPTPANVEAGTYTPLSRPLFMYTDGKPSGVLHAYFEQALSEDGQAIVEEVGYIKLPAAKLAEMRAKVA